ncbi:hypothetical protein BCV70DRAFT_218767 [Testicularia cyperi]|uniref:Uncharacterized protein n=1 Tax=Testicularia cyperi TaxID=1882483 RepID=A0A317XJ28_9BASI|nr:hypothetical protein BCV70DRAFT_218767 [Testicularia cyperi]
MSDRSDTSVVETVLDAKDVLQAAQLLGRNEYGSYVANSLSGLHLQRRLSDQRSIPSLNNETEVTERLTVNAHSCTQIDDATVQAKQTKLTTDYYIGDSSIADSLLHIATAFEEKSRELQSLREIREKELVQGETMSSIVQTLQEEKSHLKVSLEEAYAARIRLEHELDRLERQLRELRQESRRKDDLLCTSDHISSSLYGTLRAVREQLDEIDTLAPALRSNSGSRASFRDVPLDRGGDLGLNGDSEAADTLINHKSSTDNSRSSSENQDDNDGQSTTNPTSAVGYHGQRADRTPPTSGTPQQGPDERTVLANIAAFSRPATYGNDLRPTGVARPRCQSDRAPMDGPIVTEASLTIKRTASGPFAGSSLTISAVLAS